MIIMPRTTLDPDTRRRLADWLRYFRDDLGMSQQELAKELGIRPGSLSEYLSGKKDVGIGTFVRMRKLHRNANELLDRDPPSYRTSAGPPVDPRRASEEGRDTGAKQA